MSKPMLDARVPQTEIPAVYGRLAKVYDFWAGFTEVRARTVCFQRAAVRDGESILEVAVGTGLMFRDLVLANPAGATEGIDLAEPMLERARRKVEGLPGRHRLRVGDAHRLDFPDGSFDLLVNNYMFDLLPEADFGAVLAEFRRVLMPGGRLALVNMAQSLGTRYSIVSPIACAYEFIYRLSPRALGGCRGVTLAPFVDAAGFVDIQTERVTQGGFPSEVVTAREPEESA